MTQVATSPPGSSRSRPVEVTGLSFFFVFGAAMSGTSLVSLLAPGGLLEPMWRVNPRAHEQFLAMGVWAPVLMAVVCLACATAAVGLWRGRRVGFVVGVALLATSLAGDLANALSGLEPRAWFGVPIAALFLALLLGPRARAWFRRA